MSKTTPSKLSADTPNVDRFILAADEGCGELTVLAASFEVFATEMDKDLTALEQRFSAFQTPQMPPHRQTFKVH